MKDTRTLYELTADMSAIEEELYNNGGELTPELEEMLNDTQDSLTKKADGYDAVIRTFKYRSDNLAAEIKRLQAKKKASDNAAERIKNHIIDVMNQFGLKKVEGNNCRITLSQSKSLNIDDTTMFSKYEKPIEDLRKTLPPYMTIEVKVSKTELKNQFKETNILPEGVTEEEKPSLRIS